MSRGFYIAAIAAIAGATVAGVWLIRAHWSRQTEASISSLKSGLDAAQREQNSLRHQLEESERKMMELAQKVDALSTQGASQKERQVVRGLEPGRAPSRMKPRSKWINAGHGTFEACLETSMWAEAGGDVELMKQVLLIDAQVLKKAQELLDRLPEDQRMKFGSAEQVIALAMMNRKPIAAYDIVRVVQNPRNPDEVGLHLRLQSETGQIFETQDTELRRTPEGWRIRIPGQLVHARIVEVLSGSAARTPRP